jgi:hypothetical protein
MTRMARNSGRNVRSRVVRIAASLAATFALLSMSALPAYAWTTTPGATTLSSATVAVGGSQTDSALLKLTTETTSSFGSIIFNVYQGTCSSHTTLVFTATVAVTSAAMGASGHTYISPAFSPASPGNYIWLDTYTGTGTGGYPPATFACEPFTVAPHGVPEFPAGLAILMGLALPAMMLLKRRLPQQ